ncbi:kinase-like domain-containing protein [Desarmillaria tabescens]|uniref:non-specific serine/threonine protein kinase n=1 Tax=Armillaria tabescens TaxID=1929756 RepID=A0AA39JTC8_ARMTA|nr:kinase-like domain-containing protein [Desarmillaria tabescens]KAK0447446.1 kinase-like domain-containing protein [Desarmillaria tabescens]
MSELQLWDATCKAWGLHVVQSKTPVSDLSKQDTDLVQQLKEVAENVEIRDPEVNWFLIKDSVSAQPYDTADTSILIQTLQLGGTTNTETLQIQNSSESSQEEKTFSILLYAVILRSCRQNFWLGQSVEKINFDPGSGNFGSVNILYDTVSKAVFAEKRCTLPRGRPALANEESLLKRLDHIHIVRFIVEGMTKTLGKIPEDDARAVARQILDGLGYLHSQDPPIVHRDIKGANLLPSTDASRSPILASRNHYLNARTFARTVPWMAPEIVNNAKYCGTKVDVWSFGCTIIEMLCGGHPWTRKGLGHFEAMKRITAFIMPIPDGISLELQEMFAQIFVAAAERKSVNDLWLGCDWIWNKQT